MPDNKDDIASSIIARMNEISSVKYIRSDDNLTEIQREWALHMDCNAATERKNRLFGGVVRDPIWPKGAPDGWVYAWAMSPRSDVYYDLLETMEDYGASKRPRLPGVTLAHVEQRERFVNSVLAERLEEIRAQKMERGPVR